MNNNNFLIFCCCLLFLSVPVKAQCLYGQRLRTNLDIESVGLPHQIYAVCETHDYYEMHIMVKTPTRLKCTMYDHENKAISKSLRKIGPPKGTLVFFLPEDGDKVQGIKCEGVEKF